MTWPAALKALHESQQWLDQNHKLKVVLPKYEKEGTAALNRDNVLSYVNTNLK
jgi:hypothetical protein